MQTKKSMLNLDSIYSETGRRTLKVVKHSKYQKYFKNGPNSIIVSRFRLQYIKSFFYFASLFIVEKDF